MWVDPLEIRNRPLHPHCIRHIKRCVSMVRPKGSRAQQKSCHYQNGPHLTIHLRPRRWSMKASHESHNLHVPLGRNPRSRNDSLPLAGTGWYYKSGDFTLDPAGSDIATRQLLSEIGADENMEPNPGSYNVVRPVTASSPSLRRSEEVAYPLLIVIAISIR